MDRVPLIILAATWLQLLPVAGLLLPRGRGTSARVWVGLALLASFAGDMTQYFLSRQRVNNLWVGYIATAIYCMAVILALTVWQTTPRAARACRIGLGLYVVLWGLTPLIENLQQFSLVVIPAQYIFVFVLCIWTLVRNSLRDRPEPLYRYDWFWICAGFALSFGAASAIQPVANVFIARGQLENAAAAFIFRAWIHSAAMLLVATGVLWARSTAPSSLSLSPAP
ncbi:MAG TPA: hypothetical protein VFO95_11940 [Gemmatimonadales bacterium]|nr:hypothetical protein [Gemmatimonadales bacterium]